MSAINIYAEKPVQRNSADASLIVAIIMLLGLGLVTLYAASSSYALRVFGDSLYFIKRQLISCIAGMIGLLIFSYINLDFLRKMLPLFVIGSFFLCLLTFLPGIGVERNGARRWIRIPFLSTFQPSELAKIAVILFLANLFEKKRDRMDEAIVSVLPAAVGMFSFILIVFLQDDFSTAFFILIICLVVFFMAGVKLYWFFAFCLFSLPIITLFIFTESYRVNRLIAFFKPAYDLHGLNYQITAAKKAISAGGFWGEGFGTGLQKVSGIPEVQADFIFAGWAEAMGFFGVILFFALLILFVWRGYHAAFTCKDRFAAYAAFGLTSSILLQTLMNCGVVCGALPSTGIPLPFFSSGGSSLMITLVMCGIIINVSKIEKGTEMFYE